MSLVVWYTNYGAIYISKGLVHDENMVAMIGPFFYLNGDFPAHRILATQGEKRGGKLDDPYSHEKLYDDHFQEGDYINVPRGRVVWDAEKDRAIIYVDKCIEKADGAMSKIVELFCLTDFIVEYDEHYVCPDCIGEIWEA